MSGLPATLFPGRGSLTEPLISDKETDGESETIEIKAAPVSIPARVRKGTERDESTLWKGAEVAESTAVGPDDLDGTFSTSLTSFDDFPGNSIESSTSCDNVSIISATNSDFLHWSINSNHSISDGRKTKWKDAALYVHEGEKDSKIFHHPEGFWSKRAFKTLHHPAYNIAHLIASILLMLLALIETPFSLNPTEEKGMSPAHQKDKAILSLHAAVEIFLLGFFLLGIFFKFVWFGPRRFFIHRRTIFISLVLFMMTIEAFTVLIRQDSHFRVTRALRPIFLIDSYYLYGVRRVMRQIFLCIKPITDVLLLILFFVVFFSLLGYYIFSEVDPTFFSSFWRAFISLFITMTTSNNPDVMLESYFEHHLSPLFFMAYLAITFYYLMNVLLAVVYGSYEEEEKKKFKKIFKHKLLALDKAFKVLATEDDTNNSSGVTFYDFLMFMHYYQPWTPEWQVMCIFKVLHSDSREQSQCLGREEFHRLYEFRDFKWKEEKTSNVTPPVQLKCLIKIHKICHVIVKSKPFNVILNLIVLSNLFFLIIYTIVTSGLSSDRYEVLHDRKVLAVSYIYISIYIIEIILRIIGLGPYEYFKKKRNISDFVIILISFICLILETTIPKFIFLASVRPFKLLRVLRLKQKYRDIGSTTIVLLPRLTNIVVLLIIIYYFFAIIGIECLSGMVYKGCCDNNNTWFGVGSSFSGVYRENTTDNIPPSPDVYYILNFNNIVTSYVTLFVLMVVNNWYIIMEGFASEFNTSHKWLVRVYFISFFVVMLVILQVVISFIVDEFKFKVLDTVKKRTCPQHGKTFEHCRCKRYRKKMTEVTVLPADVEVLESIKVPNYRWNLSYFMRKLRSIKLNRDTQTHFIGRRNKTKEDVKFKIFKAEIKEWTNEFERNKSRKVKPLTRTAEAKKKVMIEKAKGYLRECFLYFIDWVIE